MATAAVLAAVVVPSGCSSSGSGCRSTSVRVAPPQVADVQAAFDVSATVTASGHPVAGVPVAVWGWGRPPGQTSELGGQLGSAVTGADGTATVHIPATVPGGALNSLNRLNGTEFVRVSAEAAAATVGGQAYCASKGEAPVACGSGRCMVGR
ncbi:MAG: hypothetical protein HOV87_33390 [Catenulispora sp.]|nr:hypothetical protein [Catenulispora sp.]